MEIVCILIGFSCLVYLFLTFKKRRFKIGQTWVSTYNDEDPFGESFQVKRIILDIKKGYIKYLEITEESERITSCEKSWFALNGKLQKNPAS